MAWCVSESLQPYLAYRCIVLIVLKLIFNTKSLMINHYYSSLLASFQYKIRCYRLVTIYIYIFLWCCGPTRALSSLLSFVTHNDTAVFRTPLDEWSALRTDLYQTTHKTHKRQTSMPLEGFETHNPSKRMAADPLKPRGYWDRPGFYITTLQMPQPYSPMFYHGPLSSQTICALTTVLYKI
jgi:hypothetical protein